MRCPRHIPSGLARGEWPDSFPERRRQRREEPTRLLETSAHPPVVVRENAAAPRSTNRRPGSPSSGGLRSMRAISLVNTADAAGPQTDPSRQVGTDQASGQPPTGQPIAMESATKQTKPRSSRASPSFGPRDGPAEHQVPTRETIAANSPVTASAFHVKRTNVEDRLGDRHHYMAIVYMAIVTKAQPRTLSRPWRGRRE